MFAAGTKRFLTTAIALQLTALQPTALQPTWTLAASLPSDPLIAAARAAAATYQDSLPDYIAKRTTARYRGTRAALWQPASAVRVWNQVDTVTGDVTALQGKEVYSNITINGMRAAELPNWGSWSAGEFATALLAILPPERAAALTHQHAEQLRDRAAVRYDFAVDQSHSAWRLATDHLPGSPGPQSYATAYTGAIWIDKQTGQALRIEMAARGLPNWFALNSIESCTDFDFVQIGDRSYLLPERSESLTCERNGHICLKNESVFTNYDKFVFNTSISFDDTAK
jgi:hypothetical protein